LRNVLFGGIAAITIALAPQAKAAETASYCGPSSGSGCETGTELKVYLQSAQGVTQGYGNIGSQNGLPIMSLHSDGGTFTQFIDLANGFATVTADNPAKVFNGLDITIPGYTFTRLVFDVQLADPTSGFFDTGYLLGVAIPPSQNQNGQANADKEYSITAVGGSFDEVNIFSSTGFKDIKHIEVDGLVKDPDPSCTANCDPTPTAAPEPTTLAVLGVGLLGVGFIRRRAN
jgi:hypothetical protein